MIHSHDAKHSALPGFEPCRHTSFEAQPSRMSDQGHIGEYRIKDVGLHDNSGFDHHHRAIEHSNLYGREWHMCIKLVASHFFWSAEMQKNIYLFFVLINGLPNEIVIYNCMFFLNYVWHDLYEIDKIKHELKMSSLRTLFFTQAWIVCFKCKTIQLFPSVHRTVFDAMENCPYHFTKTYSYKHWINAF